MKSAFVVVSLIVSVVAGVCPALGQDAPAPDLRINAETGRLNAVWPHDRPFDHIHMRLELDIPDINKPELKAVETLTAAPIGKGRDALVLDCDGPAISRVTIGKDACVFRNEEKKLTISLPRLYAIGEQVTLRIEYSLEFSKNHGQALTFSPGKADAKSLTSQCTQIHSQGQSELNSRWFPCHDFPNERLTTELLVTVEDGYQVLSNGHLVSKESAGAGRVRWHWLQDKPHVNYLVCLFIAKCAVIELGGEKSARPGLPIPLYTPFGTEEEATAVYSNTPRMIACFEKVFGTPYPWDKYAQAIVRDFAAGGMENTSATFNYLFSARGGAGDQDDLISHELAHQWTGDLLTCKSWEHTWLNEGWATYAEALWHEDQAKADGPEAARTAYQQAIRQDVRQQRGNRGSAPGRPAMVSNRYSDPDRVFTKPDSVYQKGAIVLHMLRMRLGDEAFFNGVRTYINRYKFTCVETDDFRRTLEEVSGQSLERFFAQWAYRPGMARVATELDWNDETKTLRIDIEQTQKIDGYNPAYALELPVLFKFEDGSRRWETIACDRRTASAEYKLPSKPASVSVDPNVTMFVANEMRKPLAMWIDELERGPTVFARGDAAEHLALSRDPRVIAAFARVAADAGAPRALRREAATLGAVALTRQRAEVIADIPMVADLTKLLPRAARALASAN